jgi:Zn-finger nucleic acid-binding protein
MRLKPDMESFQCDYCKSVYLPEKNDDGVRVLGEASGQDCPLCNVPLVHAVLAKVPIIYCKGCKGMLIPMQALEALIEELRVHEGTESLLIAPDNDAARLTAPNATTAWMHISTPVPATS